jgi:hypothetical protein
VFGFHLSSKSQHYCTNWKYWKNSLPAVLQEHKLWVILRLLNTNQAPTGFQALDWAPGIWRKTMSKPTSKWERIGCAPWFCFRWGHLKNGTDWQGSLNGVAWTKAYTSTVFTTPFCCFVLQTLSSSLKILGGFIWALEPVRSSLSSIYYVSGVLCVFKCFWQYWSLNSGLCTCKAGRVPPEPCLQPLWSFKSMTNKQGAMLTLLWAFGGFPWCSSAPHAQLCGGGYQQSFQPSASCVSSLEECEVSFSCVFISSVLA